MELVIKGWLKIISLWNLVTFIYVRGSKHQVRPGKISCLYLHNSNLSTKIHG